MNQIPCINTCIINLIQAQEVQGRNIQEGLKLYIGLNPIFNL